jgi:hypothetical protein
LDRRKQKQDFRGIRVRWFPTRSTFRNASIATRKEDIDLIHQRLKQAQAHYEQEYGK